MDWPRIEAIVYGDEYWIYPTLSDIPFGADSTDFPELKKETRAIHQVYNIQTYMDAFSSKDLVNWTKHPRVLSKENISWLRRALWAPAVIHANDKYYFFFGARLAQPSSLKSGSLSRNSLLSFWKNCLQSSFLPRALV